ncbi:hypothetical protein K466DRAFT_590146 [Polyporus arcularius HHB13444]|uniref:Uncharacterized protein n=1 Tax=Polyporus arcularius HHB13444 TaxID=1314778 RepID=A0A5C3NZS9_9APHY|nr:hypothetical protein K466DRAFT_590146 [Polyporus arcularius HHB13444]
MWSVWIDRPGSKADSGSGRTCEDADTTGSKLEAWLEAGVPRPSGGRTEPSREHGGD